MKCFHLRPERYSFLSSSWLLRKTGRWGWHSQTKIQVHQWYLPYIWIKLGSKDWVNKAAAITSKGTWRRQTFDLLLQLNNLKFWVNPLDMGKCSLQTAGSFIRVPACIGTCNVWSYQLVSFKFPPQFFSRHNDSKKRIFALFTCLSSIAYLSCIEPSHSFFANSLAALFPQFRHWHSRALWKTLAKDRNPYASDK